MSAGTAPFARADADAARIDRPARRAAIIVATIAIGLVVDRLAGFPGQVAVSLAVWALTLWLVLRVGPALGRRLVACIWISALGEMVASLAWGLYDYQFGNIPPFVPPGHALLYLLGLIIAARVGERAAWLVLAGAAVPVAVLALSGHDLLSLPLYALFAAFVVFGRQRRLYATMFVIALVLELCGTALGNWSWRPVVPGTGLPTLNPPIAAGVFYCALDWLVGRFAGLAAVKQRGAVPDTLKPLEHADRNATARRPGHEK